MSLPDGFLDELRERTSLSAVVGRKVQWDMKKTNQARGDWWAPCPFHQEKTASFHVDDAKGFYYCFGCQAKGNAFRFVQETENVSFMEAVEILAREAGMTMPARDPRAAAAEEKRAGLVEIMEMAVRFCRAQLHAAAGREARDYLAGRGLEEAVLERFEIGFAADQRQSMLAHLRSKGVEEAAIVAAGLAIKPDDGGAAFDRFRGRIMFPIRDARGRAIAFGGRALSPEARAKYLNSPETALFDKGRTLYNHGPAREAAGKAGTLVVAEGYMDVIALHRAGIPHAVAPLGTAITETQLALLWRMAEEPVIALDGDKAGLRAAHRLIDLALAALAPGRSLSFALLPEGQDPDDLLRAGGPRAVAAALADPVPLVEMLWRRETETRRLETPEQRAGLDRALRDLLATIPDRAVRRHYAEALDTRRRTLFRPARPARGQGPRRGSGRAFGFAEAPAAAPLPDTRASLLGRADAGAAARVREATILLACLRQPALAAAREEMLDRLSFENADLAALRDALLTALAGVETGEKDAAARLRAALAPAEEALAALEAMGPVRANRHLAPGADPAATARILDEALGRQRALTGAAEEIAEAEAAFAEAQEGLDWRLAETAAARERALRGTAPGDTEERDEAALSRALQGFIDDAIWEKKGRGR